eukprot:SAG31_NODE_161_length_21899_cov_16.832844_11_plen_350_part_00
MIPSPAAVHMHVANASVNILVWLIISFQIMKALEHFTKASEIDPENMAYLSNRSACYYELKDYDKAIEESKAAVELGKEKRADFSLMAKAYARIGNAYAVQKMFVEAIDYYDLSLMEDHDEKVQKKLSETKKAKKKKEQEDFLDDDISEEEKAKGNELFQKGDYHEALKHYTEAIARNPKNHLIYSNRCACFQKINQFPAALADCEKCIELCPTFAKIYNRKGNIQFYLKEYHKCIETFQKVIELEPESRDATEAKEMIQKTQYAIQASARAPADEQQQARAMQDPEVQAILADPQIRGMLANMQAVSGLIVVALGCYTLQFVRGFSPVVSALLVAVFRAGSRLKKPSA